MRIIFLDIDGVLNCDLHYRSQQFIDYREAKKSLKKQVKKEEISGLEYYAAQICKERLSLLNELCEQTGAKVVISSTWRMGKEVKELQEIFKYCGGTFEIIGKTGYTGFARGTEIKKWIDNMVDISTFGCNYSDFRTYVIIDDDSDMLLNQREHFFQTDTYAGLTPNICYRIKRFFDGIKNRESK